MASNITVSNLVVAPGVQQTYAQWEVNDPNVSGLPYLQLDRVILYASTTDDFDTAVAVAEGITFANYVYSGFEKRYHWVVARDKSGQLGERYPSGGGVVTGGVWQDFTPTVTARTGTITSYDVSAEYFKIGPNVTFSVRLLIVVNGTGAGDVRITLPVPMLGLYPILGVREEDLKGLVGYAYTPSNAVVALYDGTYPGTDAYTLSFGGVYQANE